MAGKPIGTIYAELDLDTSKYTAAQKKILYDSQTLAINQENAWKVLGQKSDLMYDAMRKQAENAYKRIAADSKSSASEIIRAEEAKNAKIKQLNEQQFGHQNSIIESLKQNWIGISAAILAGFYAIKKFFDMAELGAQVKSIEESFVLMGRNSGIAIDGLIEKLKQATNETIDDSDLMRKATRLIAEGFSSEQIIEIGEAARVAARLMGTDVSQAYEQIADSIVNLRERGLKTAGFIIDLEAAYEKHAKTLGITKNELNDYGKQMAMMNAVTEKTIELQNKLGMSMETASEKIQKQKSIWKEFGDNLAKAASEAWQLLNALISLGLSKAPKVSPEAWGGERPIVEGPESNIELALRKKAIQQKSQVAGMTTTDLLKLEQRQLEENAKAYGDYADSVISELEKLNQFEIDRRNDRIKIEEYARQKILEGETEFNKELIEAWDATNQMYVDIAKRREEESSKFLTSLSQNISDVWSTNLSRMITDSQNAADAFKNIWKGIADAIISAIVKMMVQWLIFDSITKSGSGWGTSSQTGYGGIISSVGSIIALLEKGGVMGPLLAHYPIRSYATGGIARTPQIGIFGEGGNEGEAFVPLQNGKIPVRIAGEDRNRSGTNATFFQIVAMDPISWRDFVRRNPEAIMEQIRKSARGAGDMRDTVKGVN